MLKLPPQRNAAKYARGFYKARCERDLLEVGA
jgi:hypothetical protein